MKAVVISKFGGPEVLEYTAEFEKPVPQKDEVLVAVKAVGVNPVETYIRAGAYAKDRLPTLPAILGRDAAGVIDAVGQDVKKWKKGDRVYVAGARSGSYAEFCVASENSVFNLPEQVSFAQGAAVNIPYGTAYRALFIRTNTKPGNLVFIHGASGGVGIACCQLASNFGAIVIGTASTDDGKALAIAAGAKAVFNHRESGYAEKIKQFIRETYSADGFDVIVEMLANINLATDISLLRKSGTIAIVGNRGDSTINARGLMGSESSIVGVAYGNTSPDESFEIHSHISNALANGNITPVVGKEFKLEEAAKAHDDIINGRAKGKMVLLV